MANLNLGQDVANKTKRKQTTTHIVAKSYRLQLAVRMCRYGSLIKIYPSEGKEVTKQRFMAFSADDTLPKMYCGIFY